MHARVAIVSAACLGAVLAAPPARADFTGDAAACFRVRDDAPRGRFRTTLAATGESCIVKTPAKFACLASALQDTVPAGAPAPGGDVLLCYPLKCPRPNPPATTVADALGGARPVRFRGARWLCTTPTAAGAAPTTTTPPTTVTTTTTFGVSDTCDFRDGECRGTCGPGRRCGAAVGTASCECLAVGCGQAETPTCDGACASPDDACVWDPLDDECTCVGIP